MDGEVGRRTGGDLWGEAAGVDALEVRYIAQPDTRFDVEVDGEGGSAVQRGVDVVVTDFFVHPGANLFNATKPL